MWYTINNPDSGMMSSATKLYSRITACKKEDDRFITLNDSIFQNLHLYTLPFCAGIKSKFLGEGEIISS